MKADLAAINSFDNPTNVVPVESTISLKGKQVNLVAAPYSFNVLRVKMQ
jgi:alpha-L-arabinofuranosidase